MGHPEICTTNCKNNTAAEVGGVASQVIAEKHGANLGHPTFRNSLLLGTYLCRIGTAGAHQLSHSASKKHRVVEGLGPRQSDAVFGSKVLKSNIDIVEHFDVIAHKADWLNEKKFVTCGGKLLDHAFNRGAEPLSPAHALALEGEVPLSGNFRNAGGD